MFSSPSNTRDSEIVGNQRHTFGQSLRGTGAGPEADTSSPSAPSRPAWRIELELRRGSRSPLHVRRFPEPGRMYPASKLRRPSCTNPRAMALPERFIRTLKEDLLWDRHFKPSRNCAPSSSHSPGATNRLWLVARHRYKTRSEDQRGAKTMPPICN